MHLSRSPRALRYATGLLAGIALLTAACGGGQQASQPAPTTAPAKPAEATAAAPTSAPNPAASPAPSPGASPAAKPVAGPSPAAAAGAGSVRFELVAEGSEARYRAQEQLSGRNLPSEAVGVTKGITGAIVLAPNGAIVPDQSKITVDLSQLASDQSRRDNYIKGNTLEVARFPNAELVPREVRGLPWPLPASGEATFELLGDLAVRGVSRPTTWSVQAQLVERQASGVARTRVKMTDFGMTPPRVGPVLSIEDELTLELEFRANREPAPAAGTGPQPPAAAGGPASGSSGASAARSSLRAQLVSCEPTPADSLGPFYKPGAPLRDGVGSGYVVSGTVRAAATCEPVPGAQLEFWLANPQGIYDDEHRATLLAGPQGEYRFESDPPVPYTGRPPHIHIRVTSPNGRVFVTQHYPQAGQSEAVFDLVF